MSEFKPYMYNPSSGEIEVRQMTADDDALGSGQVQSGHIASGQIGRNHLAVGIIDGAAIGSGSIQSGHVGSGSVPGFFGPTRAIQSGTVGAFDFGSGAVMAGQVGSGAVRSGNLASGQVGVNHIGAAGTPDNTTFLRGDMQWATPPGGALTSGSVQSGHVASGAVGGFYGATRHVQSGTVGGFDFASGAVEAGRIGSGAVQSGNVASGAIGPNHFGSGAVLSGAVASGQIGFGHLASGSVGSGSLASGQVTNLKLGSGAVTSGTIASGSIGVNHTQSGVIFGVPWTLTSGQVVSGNIASGQVGTGHLADGAVQSGDVASGNIGRMHLASGAVNSGHLNTTGTPDNTTFLRGDMQWVTPPGGSLTSGSVQSGHVASGSVGGFFGATRHIQSGTIGSFDLGSGAVTAGAIGSGAVVSGNIASGQIGISHFASGETTNVGDHFLSVNGSGLLITAAQFVKPYSSGSQWSAITAEIISGTRAVKFNQSGALIVAMASVSGRMPADGVIFDNVLSGLAAQVYVHGPRFQLTSGMGDYSGWLGQGLIVGRSGQIVTMSGSWNSGGLLSGDVYQMLGTPVNSGALMLAVGPASVSGHVLGSGVVGSGNIGSGQVGRFHVGSGQIFGNVGGTVINIASGTIGASFLGSGAVQSGQLASGQVGVRHIGATGTPDNTTFLRGDMTWATAGGGLTSGAVQSGHVASGAIEGHLGATFHVASGTLGDNDHGSGVLYKGGTFTAIGEVGGVTTFDRTNPDITVTLAIADDAVVSGRIGSGQVGPMHIASGQIFGNIGGSPIHIASGSIGANFLGSGAVRSGQISSGVIGRFHLGSGIVVSGFVVGSGALRGMDGNNAYHIASGSVAGPNIADGTIRSGHVVSGQIGWPHLSSGCIRSGHLAVAGTPDGSKVLRDDFTWVAPGAPTINSGDITSGKIGNNAVVSGSVASGQIGQYHLSSGIDIALDNIIRWVNTTALISGVKGVVWASGGPPWVRVPEIRSGNGGAFGPVIGVTISGADSGQTCAIVTRGTVFYNVSGMGVSGLHGDQVYVGSGGIIIPASGTFAGGASSGAGARSTQVSGTVVFPIGQSVSGGVRVQPAFGPMSLSGILISRRGFVF